MSAASKRPGLEEEPPEHVPEEEEGHRRGDDEEGDALEAPIDALSQPLRALGAQRRLARELGQLGRRDRHAEERYREERQELRVAQHRHRLGGDEGGVVGVHQRADLHDAAGDEDGEEPPEHGPHRGAGGVERRPEPSQQWPERRELHGELERAARRPRPGEQRREPVLDPTRGPATARTAICARFQTTGAE